jgi:hypothetical protein
MRDDQLKRLEDMAERVMDEYLQDADPVNWPGSGIPACDMEPSVRGDRNWTVKNANQVGALLMRSLDIKERLKGGDWEKGKPADDQAEADIGRYEKEAKRLLDTMSAKRGG